MSKEPETSAQLGLVKFELEGLERVEVRPSAVVQVGEVGEVGQVGQVGRLGVRWVWDAWGLGGRLGWEPWLALAVAVGAVLVEGVGPHQRSFAHLATSEHPCPCKKHEETDTASCVNPAPWQRFALPLVQLRSSQRRSQANAQNARRPLQFFRTQDIHPRQQS